MVAAGPTVVKIILWCRLVCRRNMVNIRSKCTAIAAATYSRQSRCIKRKTGLFGELLVPHYFSRHAKEDAKNRAVRTKNLWFSRAPNQQIGMRRGTTVSHHSLQIVRR